jgi:membrane protease subunit (stomatin/prohibitin family)
VREVREAYRPPSGGLITPSTLYRLRVEHSFKPKPLVSLNQKSTRALSRSFKPTMLADGLLHSQMSMSTVMEAMGDTRRGFSDPGMGTPRITMGIGALNLKP